MFLTHLWHSIIMSAFVLTLFVGYVSCQLDGGIEAGFSKMEALFTARNQQPGAPRIQSPAASLKIGVVSNDKLPTAVLAVMEMAIAAFVRAGATVVCAGTARISSLFPDPSQESLGYGQHVTCTGLHVMYSPSSHFVELVTGLAATGVEIIVTYSPRRALQTHHLVPIIQCADTKVFGADVVISEANSALMSATCLVI